MRKIGEEFWEGEGWKGQRPTDKMMAGGAAGINKLVSLLSNEKAMRQVERVADKLGGMFKNMAESTVFDTINRILNVFLGPFLPLIEILMAKVEEKLMPAFSEIIDKFLSGEMDQTLDNIATMITEFIKVNWGNIMEIGKIIADVLAEHGTTLVEAITGAIHLLADLTPIIKLLADAVQGLLDLIPQGVTTGSPPQNILYNIFSGPTGAGQGAWMNVCTPEYAEWYYKLLPQVRSLFPDPCSSPALGLPGGLGGF